MSIVMSDAMLDFISEQTHQYYVAQNTDSSYTDSLRSELTRVEMGIENIFRAVEAGMFSAAAKVRMDELEEQKENLKVALADAELIHGLRLTKEQIKFFLFQFRDLSLNELDSQRRVIEIFVNSVFVYVQLHLKR